MAMILVDSLDSSSCVWILHCQVVTALELLLPGAPSTPPVSLVVRFGTSTGDGYFGSVGDTQLVLRMTASILTSGTAKYAVILGQQVRAPSW